VRIPDFNPLALAGGVRGQVRSHRAREIFASNLCRHARRLIGLPPVPPATERAAGAADVWALTDSPATIRASRPCRTIVGIVGDDSSTKALRDRQLYLCEVRASQHDAPEFEKGVRGASTK
jgi:hypothetical protein